MMSHVYVVPLPTPTEAKTLPFHAIPIHYGCTSDLRMLKSLDIETCHVVKDLETCQKHVMKKNRFGHF